MGRAFTLRNGRDPGSGSNSNVDMNLEDRLDNPVERVRQVVGHTDHTLRSLWRQISIPPNTQNLSQELNGENNSIAIEEMMDKKDDVRKNNGEESSFFDCNVCLDLAKEPIVTCCGHLFCWPCIYRWLNRNPDFKECPVCKGEVNVNDVTPIHGRGNNILRLSMDSCPNIPLQPHARRVESLRQAIQRAVGPTASIENLLRRFGGPVDFTQSQSQNSDGDEETSNLLLNRILTSRGMRRQLVDLTDGPPLNDDVVRDNHHAINSTEVLADERLFGSIFPIFGDMNSIFRLTDDVIHSENLMVDNAVGIDSTVAMWTSSSSSSSRVSDVDSGDSRILRRRLN